MHQLDSYVWEYSQLQVIIHSCGYVYLTLQNITACDEIAQAFLFVL